MYIASRATAGPWKATRPNTYQNDTWTIESEHSTHRRVMLASLIYEGNIEHDEQQANAQLMASAPDLFHAVRIAHAICVTHTDPESCMRDKPIDWADLRDYFRLTIQRALEA